MADYDISGVNPPFNAEAEQSVIGAILANKEVIGDIIEDLHAEHFFSDV